MLSEKIRNAFSRNNSILWISGSIFLLVCIIYYHWSWSNILASFGGDNAVYLLTAQYYSPYSQGSAVAEYFAHNNIYPPLFPLLLALFGGGESLLTAHIITTTCLLISFAFLFLWVRAESGKTHLSLLLVLALALLPGVYMQALSVLSENLYMCLIVASLYLVHKSEQTKKTSFIWWAVLAIGLVSLTRSVGISFIAAFIVYLLVNGIDRKWRYSFAAALPYVLWKLFTGTGGGSYFGQFLHRYGDNPLTTLIEHLNVELHALWWGWQNIFSTSQTSIVFPTLLMGLSLAAVVMRIKAKKLDGFYIPIYLLIILIWPFPAEAERFLLAIVPILMAQIYLILVAIHLPRIRKFSKELLASLYLLLMFINIIPGLIFTVQRFSIQPPDEIVEYNRHISWYEPNLNAAMQKMKYVAAIADNLQYSAKLLLPNDCVYSIKPSIISYLIKHKSIAPPASDSSDQQFQTALNSTACRYFYFVRFTSLSYTTPYYPMNRLRKVKLQMLTATYLDPKDDSSAIAYLSRLSPSRPE